MHKLAYDNRFHSVIVPVSVVGGMAVPVVQVVDMAVVKHGHMTAVFAVLVVMLGVHRVLGLCALVHMAIMSPVDVAVVGVVGVISVLEGNVTAPLAVLVRVVGVGSVVCGDGHL